MPPGFTGAGTGRWRFRGAVTMAADEDALARVLEESRRLGFLGPGPVAGHLEHADRYREELVTGSAVGTRRPLVADLGAGGGLPSLPLACALPDHVFVLVDAAAKRAAFLVWATVELGVEDRVEVWTGRAEDFAHREDRRGRFDVVVARGFGPPASTLECGGPLLVPGGRLVVSEPPGYRQFPEDAVARCGLVLVVQRRGLAVFSASQPAEPHLPRPWRQQQRKPLF